MTEDDQPGPSRRRAGTSGRLIKPKPVKSAAETFSTTDALPVPAPPEANSPRFHFFLIDSGWDGPVPAMIRNNLDMITQYQNHDPFFILTRKQSNELLRKHPHLIGKDPILLARDLKASKTGGQAEYHGFHLNLGIMRDPNKALAVLKAFLGFLATHRHTADIEKGIREKLHRDGFQGAIEVLRVGSEAIIGG
jgi:hypothetical protein